MKLNARLGPIFLIAAAALLAPPALAEPLPTEGVIRPAGPRWTFKDGDRLYWFGASHTAVGIYCSTVEFYIRTRLPDVRIVAAHTSKPLSLDAKALPAIFAERRPSVVFPEGGFYDTKDTNAFVNAAAAVAAVCTNSGVRCIFLPTMWLGNATNRLHPDFLAQNADFAAVETRLRAEKKLPYGAMLVPRVIEGAYFRPAVGLALDATMAALKEWGDRTGRLVLGTYDDQAAWAKAQWARDARFVFLDGSSPHPSPAGYMVVGWSALEHLDAPILESRLVLAVDGGKAEAKESVNCAASDVAVGEDGVTFKRLDKVLPVVPPVRVGDIPGDPAPVLKLSPYYLTVTGLSTGRYVVAVEGTTIAAATADELAKGVNLNELYLRTGFRGNPKFPWSNLWLACRGNTMDKDYVPAENERIGQSAWTWRLKRIP